LTALARAGRPLLWLGVIVGTLWPLTGQAAVASVIVLAGAVCAILAARDPRIPAVTGEGERWRAGLLSLCALAGVVASVVEPRGAGYVAALAAGGLVGRVVIDARLVWGISTVAGVAVGVTLAAATGSPWALLTGLGVPALASRSLDRARLHREHARVLALLAERDALREVELAAAAGQERARIARDLHDVLAHTLSGLSLHLQGIRAIAAKRLGADDPVIGSVDRAADLARAGLAEAKEAVAALREDSPASAPRAADLAALADGHGAALSVSGDLDALGPQLRETVFATVREALTNAGRHAPDAAVTIEVAVGDAIEVRVTDDGAGGAETADDRGDVGGGKGLVGLRERAALAGGVLDAGPLGDRGWRVSLRVPLPVAAGHPAG
jgi:signal transduction histidine kinase